MQPNDRHDATLYNVSVPKDSGQFESIPPPSFPHTSSAAGNAGNEFHFVPDSLPVPRGEMRSCVKAFPNENKFLALLGKSSFSKKTEFLQIQHSLKMISNAETIV